MNFINDKILPIRGNIYNLLPSTSTDLYTNKVALETAVNPDIYLDVFSPIILYQTVSTSKPSTGLLDPIRMRLLQEVLPLVTTSQLDIFNVSLLTGHVPVLQSITFS